MNDGKLRNEITQSNAPINSGSNLPGSGGNIEPYVVVSESFRELVEKWYVNPLKKLDTQHDGFAILTLLFPLYEKHLRFSLGDQKFSENSPVVRQIGKDLSISTDQAYGFWQIFRNGLLHKAIPDSTDQNYDWAMTQATSKPIEIKERVLYINPILLKDKVIQLVMNKVDMWKKDDLFPKRYRQLNP